MVMSEITTDVSDIRSGMDIKVGDEYQINYSKDAREIGETLHVRAIIDGACVITRQHHDYGSLAKYLSYWHYRIWDRDEFELLAGHHIIRIGEGK